jgi:exopolysaccharide biosynthesis polyprenyl glycosylphosphotransferase
MRRALDPVGAWRAVGRPPSDGTGGTVLDDQSLARNDPPGVGPAAGPATAGPATASRGQPHATRAVRNDPTHPARPRPRARHFARTPAAAGASWEARYQRILVLADFAVGLAAGGIAFAARFGTGAEAEHNRIYLVAAVVLPVLFVAALAANRAYERRHLFVGAEEYQRVIRAGLWLVTGLAVISYGLDLPLARGWLLVALPAGTISCLAVRFALRRQVHRARARGEGLRRVVVVGHALAVAELAARLSRESFHGMQVVGACLPPDHEGTVDLPVFGTFEQVGEAIEAADADTVIVLGCPELDGVAVRRLAWRLERDDVDLILASSLIDVAGDRTTIRPVDGLPMLHVEHPRLTGGARLVKEMVDRLGSALLLVAFGPLLLALAACVRLGSPGPALFRQVRVGRDGREFVIYKFRTMYLEAEARLAEIRHLNEHDGVLFKIRNDPRVTGVGRWLRRLSLDELPQLINVLRGQMSLVGPRPPLPDEVAAYPDDLHRRLAVKPGITGLWQVSGRSDLPWDEAVRLDLRYVENWSLSLDLVIMLRTVSAVFRTSGAY